MSKKTNNKQLLFLHDNVTNGGGEKMFRWLGQNLRKKGYDVRFLFMYDNHQIDTSELEADYIGLSISKSYFIRNLKYFTIGAYKLFRYFCKNRVHYVVSFGTNSFYLIGLYKSFWRYKIMVSERADPQCKRFSWLRKKLFAQADYCVFQTEGAKKFFSLNNDTRSFIIPNPVNIPHSPWNDEDSDNVIISVGRLDLNHKRQDVLVKAFERVHQLYPNIQLRLVGEGGDKERLEHIITELNLTQAIVLTGQIKDVKSELQKARLFVLTSEFEGIPNALLEAMAIGMPVVSTDCSPGGAAFLIGNNQYGILTPRGDVERIADSILFFLNNPDKRIEYGKLARMRASEFSEESIIQRWEDVVNHLLHD